MIILPELSILSRRKNAVYSVITGRAYITHNKEQIHSNRGTSTLIVDAEILNSIASTYIY